jgi:pseudouridine kinase
MGIVVIGAVFVDIKGYPLSTYIPGGRNAGRVEQVHGGVCRNVAEDIANVELRPTFVSLVDDTGSGQDVIDKLARHKVNTRYIQRMPDGMGTWLAVFNNDGDVCAAISKRPDTTPLTALLKEKGDEIFADCDGIAIEFDLEKETVKQILHFAKKYRKKVYAAVSNMSIAMERRSLLQEIDCFVCNQQEAGLMFSDDYDHLTPDEMRATLAANVREAARAFSRLHIEVLVEVINPLDMPGFFLNTPQQQLDLLREIAQPNVREHGRRRRMTSTASWDCTGTWTKDTGSLWNLTIFIRFCARFMTG